MTHFTIKYNFIGLITHLCWKCNLNMVVIEVKVPKSMYVKNILFFYYLLKTKYAYTFIYFRRPIVSVLFGKTVIFNTNICLILLVSDKTFFLKWICIIIVNFFIEQFKLHGLAPAPPSHWVHDCRCGISSTGAIHRRPVPWVRAHRDAH